MGSIKKIWIIIITVIIFSACSKDAPSPTPIFQNPQGTVEIKIGNEVIFEQIDNPCEILPTASTVYGTKNRNLVQPSIYIKAGDLSPFIFKFYFEDMDFVGDLHRSRYDSLKERIFTSKDLFNLPPYQNNFILFFHHKGKRYANSWDPEVRVHADGSNSFIRDHTGLKFHPQVIEEVQLECPEQSNQQGLNVIRMKANFEGKVVSQDHSDTITINGNIDILISGNSL